MSEKADQTDELANQNDIEPETGESPAAEASADDELSARLAEAEARAQDNWDKAVRAQAELENVRRRAQRDVENAHKYAIEKFLQDMLPVQDSMEMGLSAAQNENADIEKLREGTELILKMFADLMDKHGVEAIDPMGQPFDPEHHQAMSMLESAEHAPDTVVAVMQKGYKLNDRLVRPAMVAVSRAPANAEPGNVDEKA